MKKLPIRSAGHVLLIAGFGEWLDIQGYGPGTRASMPAIVREFLHHVETEGCTGINALKSEHLRSYHVRITTRANQRRGGGLSNNTITKHVQALDKFFQYLHHRGVQELPSIGIKPPKVERPPIVVLSVEDIGELSKACGPQDGEAQEEALRARDRTLLAVFYGCGLRRNEGAHLRLDDIDLEARTVRVRKGKGHKERLVPLSKAGARQVQDWILDHRPLLAGQERTDALFIGTGGSPLTGGRLYHCLKRLQQRTTSAELRAKAIGLHTLRHAIATHLLAAGMEIQKIARFLGHSSLESTQIYTHLAEEEADGHLR